MTKIEAYRILSKMWNDATPEQDEAINIAMNCIEFVDLMPKNMVPVVHGRWELGKVEPGYFTPGGNRPWTCSECGYPASWMLDRPTYNYCPNCGARMDGERDATD